ncbi:hypothetical protein R6Q59_020538 [Mikania micrantha]
MVEKQKFDFCYSKCLNRLQREAENCQTVEVGRHREKHGGRRRAEKRGGGGGMPDAGSREQGFFGWET